MIIFYFLALFGVSLAQNCWRNTPCSTLIDAAFHGPWDKNIYAPSSRTVAPKSVLSLSTGQVISAYPGPVVLGGNGASLVLDFGLEVGGIITLKYLVSGLGSGSIGLAFTEAKDWIGRNGDASNGGFSGQDGPIYANFTGSGSYVYTMPDEKLRGGFRYMTLFLESSSATVNITSISLELGFMPTWSNLQAYQGYFHSDDELLNKIWYSGAYTLQTVSVPVNYGRMWPPIHNGWYNNMTLGPGYTIIVDGAKRDRCTYPGDMGVAVPSMFYSLGDMDSAKNALQTLYNIQKVSGELPEAGPPMYLWSSDIRLVQKFVEKYKLNSFKLKVTQKLRLPKIKFFDPSSLDKFPFIKAVFYRTVSFSLLPPLASVISG